MTWDGTDRRMGSEEQIGYIKGKVEALDEDIKEMKESLREQKNQHKELMSELRSLREEQSFYRHCWWMLKAIVLTVAGVLTLKLGDILTLFKGVK